MTERNSWIPLSEKTLLKSPVMDIIQRECKSSEDARVHQFYFFRAKDWCNIIPVTEDGKIVMVRQFRIGVSRHTLEIPGGVVDAQDSDLQTAALREMTEETGYSALPGARCLPVGWTYPNPAIQDNRCHSFIVGPVKKLQAQNLDAGEMIEVVEVPIEELPARVLSGEINHALMLNAFFFLQLRTAEGAENLKDALRALI